jgi:hypothetical protein
MEPSGRASDEQATTTPTPYVPLLPEGGAYVKCIEFNDGYHIECYPGEVYHKTTQLDGVSVDMFVNKKGMKCLRNMGILTSIT